MNPLTCYVELSPKPFFVNGSLIRNFITTILTIKENKDTYYHNALKYVPLILRIKKLYFVENVHENLRGSIYFTTLTITRAYE